MSTLFSEIDTMKKQGMTNTQIASIYDGKYSVKYIDELYARQRNYNLACTLEDENETVKSVGRLRAQKLKPYYIAKELKIPVSLVSAIIQTKDFYIKRRLTSEQMAKLRECAKQGMTIREAAEANGFEYYQVQSFAKNHKCKFITTYAKNRMAKKPVDKKHITDSSLFDSAPLTMKSIMSQRWSNA